MEKAGEPIRSGWWGILNPGPPSLIKLLLLLTMLLPPLSPIIIAMVVEIGDLLAVVGLATGGGIPVLLSLTGTAVH